MKKFSRGFGAVIYRGIAGEFSFLSDIVVRAGNLISILNRVHGDFGNIHCWNSITFGQCKAFRQNYRFRAIVTNCTMNNRKIYVKNKPMFTDSEYSKSTNAANSMSIVDNP